jgi:SnoaL-like domain
MSCFATVKGSGTLKTSSNTKWLESMSDPRVKTYETYLSAWSPIPDDERVKLLHESLSQDIVFTNPTQTRRGLADVAVHLQGFKQRSPGGSFRMNEMLGWENHGLATWQFVDVKGQAGSGAMTCLRTTDRAASKAFSCSAMWRSRC